MRVEYHPFTVLDVNSAVAYYESKQEGLGVALRDAIYRTIVRIADSPVRYPVVKNNIRRCFVSRFPFSVLYSVVDEEVIRILVIRHHRQHQSFGLSRQ